MDSGIEMTDLGNVVGYEVVKWQMCRWLTEFNTEEYNGIRENNFKAVKNYPMSTFSVDVDTASYSNVRL